MNSGSILRYHYAGWNIPPKPPSIEPPEKPEKPKKNGILRAIIIGVCWAIFLLGFVAVAVELFRAIS